MTELLILKEEDYFRFSPDGVQPCGMNKASVYPLDRYDEVKTLLHSLHEAGYTKAKIMKLTITEEPYALP